MSNTVELLEKISQQQQIINRLEEQLEENTRTGASSFQRLQVFESAVKMMPQAFYWISTLGIIKAYSTSFFDWLGLDNSRELEGFNLYDILNQQKIPDQIIQSIEKNNAWVVNQNKQSIVEEQMQVGGHKSTFLCYRTPVTSTSGQVLGVACVACDITQRKKIDEQNHEKSHQAAFEHVGSVDFLSKSRHDIKTPLANLVGLTKLLNDYGDQEDVIKDIHYSAKQLERMIEEILDFTTKQCLAEPNEKDEFSINQLVTEAKGTIRMMLKEQQIEFKEYISQQLCQYVKVNRVRLQRIITNLLVNAVKHSRTDVIELSITPSSQFDGKGMLLIIKDHGVGIPERYINMVMKGARLVAGQLTNDESEGLGLNIIQEYVDDLGGVMVISSQVGVGTEFKIHIPYESVSHSVDSKSDHLV
tara:strand:+ start:9865 stop:11112 length:1248 start_codon:yes stop_codon:yes gene_type:complete